MLYVVVVVMGQEIVLYQYQSSVDKQPPRPRNQNTRPLETITRQLARQKQTDFLIFYEISTLHLFIKLAIIIYLEIYFLQYIKKLKY